MKKYVFTVIFSLIAAFAFCEGMSDHIAEINREYSTTDIQNLRDLVLDKYKICSSLSSAEVESLITAINCGYMLPMVYIDADFLLGSILFELAIKHPTPVWQALDYNGRIAIISRIIPELKYVRYMDNMSVPNPALLRGLE